MQDLLEAKEIEFDAPEIPIVITAPMLKHDRGVNAIEDDAFVTSVEELVTPLMTVKWNLLKAGLFLGCIERCYCCAAQPNGFKLLEEGI